MKKALFIVLSLLSISALAQTEEDKLKTTMREFHQAMVNKNTISINQQTDKGLSYGHSNGWVETKTDLIKDLETGYIVYNSFTEDSVTVTISGNLANVRFIADIRTTMHANTMQLRLKVLEVWVKKGKRWLLFSRQATR